MCMMCKNNKNKTTWMISTFWVSNLRSVCTSPIKKMICRWLPNMVWALDCHWIVVQMLPYTQRCWVEQSRCVTISAVFVPCHKTCEHMHRLLWNQSLKIQHGHMENITISENDESLANFAHISCNFDSNI